MITDFIALFEGDINYLTGRCYMFAQMLNEYFPGGEIIYDDINCHFLYKYKENFYDVRGEVNEPSAYFSWADYPDSLRKQRIVEGCVDGKDELENHEAYCIDLYERYNEYQNIIKDYC